MAPGQQSTTEPEEEEVRGKLYLHLHLGTDRQAVSAALVDGSAAVWKTKKKKKGVSPVGPMVAAVVLRPARVCGKVGARKSDWFS